MQKYLEVGQIVNTFGVSGEVKVYPYTDDIKRFSKLKSVYIEKKSVMQEYKIQNVRYHKNMVIIKFENVENMNDAELLKNCYLKIDRKDAIKLPKDTFFIADLIGLDVYTDEGKLLGKVEDIYSTGSNDIYVVKDELGKQVLLPAIKDVLKDINLEERKITVHIIKGLI